MHLIVCVTKQKRSSVLPCLVIYPHSPKRAFLVVVAVASMMSRRLINCFHKGSASLLADGTWDTITKTYCNSSRYASIFLFLYSLPALDTSIFDKSTGLFTLFASMPFHCTVLPASVLFLGGTGAIILSIYSFLWLTLVDDMLKTGTQGAVFSSLKDGLFIRYVTKLKFCVLLFFLASHLYFKWWGKCCNSRQGAFSEFRSVLYSLRLSNSYPQ